MSDSNNKSLRIGTRNSPLALKQADMLQLALLGVNPNLDIEIIPIKSAADWKKQDGERSLCEQNGGKGQFAKEIEQIHLEGQIDCGVHSLKDMASILPEGLQITHVLPRADSRDAFISANYKTIDDLPDGATIGTCSPRRQAIALSKRPDLKVAPFRGNVQTRLNKVRDGQVDATFLAMAGLTRLGIEDEMIYPLSTNEMLPACGQGIVCIETKSEDTQTQQTLDSIHCVKTGLCAVAEREVLKVLDGSCHTPIAAYAIMEENIMHIKAQVFSSDGQTAFEKEGDYACESSEQAIKIGHDVGQYLKSLLPAGFLD